mmetsp:Transcript_2276/g.3490  ORF Transcript_2276/g.3490 Transcript_2276/m.3490 type:complete len:207 (+) Transcript_2276:189-809(+)
MNSKEPTIDEFVQQIGILFNRLNSGEVSYARLVKLLEAAFVMPLSSFYDYEIKQAILKSEKLMPLLRDSGCRQVTGCLVIGASTWDPYCRPSNLVNNDASIWVSAEFESYVVIEFRSACIIQSFRIESLGSSFDAALEDCSDMARMPTKINICSAKIETGDTDKFIEREVCMICTSYVLACKYCVNVKHTKCHRQEQSINQISGGA